MAKFIGDKLELEIYGESHSEKIGVKVKGMPNFTFDKDKLTEFLNRRKPSNNVYSTLRKEDDIPNFIGIENNTTIGEFSAEIYNTNQKSKDYNNLYGKPRPSHADYTSFCKDNTLDFSGGGRFSGRLTAPLCIVGGILKQYLESLGIYVEGYISSINGVKGKSYKTNEITREEIRNSHKTNSILENSEEMIKQVENAKKSGDSVGGIIEVIVFNMPKGIGDNLFEGLESKISSLIYSVPAVKGVEFGAGFNLTQIFGSVANDELVYNANGEVEFLSNNSGGINGGISNGNQITISVAVKPTPSISKPQRTVDLVKKENTTIEIGGRHDSCITFRAVPCIESAVILAIYDSLK